MIEAPKAGPPIGAWSYLRRYQGKLVWGGVLLLATNALFLGVPIMLGEIVDALQGDDPAGEVPRLALYMIAFAVATAVTRIGSRIAIFNAGREAEYDLRADLFAHLLRFEPAFFRANPTGDIMSRLTNDVQTIRAMWGAGFLNVINTAFAFITVFAMMIAIDPWLTLWATLPYPAMVIIGRVFGRYIYRASRAVQEQLGTLSSTVQEDLTGIGIIKTYALEKPRQGIFDSLSHTLLGGNMRLTLIRGLLMPALTLLGTVGTVVVWWLGGQAVISGRISLGDLIEFSAYLARLVWPTLALGWMLSLFQRGMASWQRLADLLRARPRIGDGPGPDPDLATVRGNVEVRNLTIEADGREILSNVSLSFPAGSITAIVGRTGSGKSTLVEALPRLVDVPPNTVFLDGRDITELSLSALRRAIGYAPQEAFLFSTTIAANIAFGYQRGARTGPRTDDPRLRRAADAAGLSGDVAGLPDGYDTVVGERGITLSGGQRQRVALARALATEPKVLILDDSLSSVDAETEREILSHLAEVMAGRTAILISHRVAAVKRADQIVVLDEGRIVEVGTHDELLAAGGAYAEVYQSQLQGELDVTGGES